MSIERGGPDPEVNTPDQSVKDGQQPDAPTGNPKLSPEELKEYQERLVQGTKELESGKAQIEALFSLGDRVLYGYKDPSGKYHTTEGTFDGFSYSYDDDRNLNELWVRVRFKDEEGESTAIMSIEDFLTINAPDISDKEYLNIGGVIARPQEREKQGDSKADSKADKEKVPLENLSEIEKTLLNAVEHYRDASREKVQERYPGLTGRLRSFFAGEYADIKTAETVGLDREQEAETEQISQETIQKKMAWWKRETLLRAGKVLGKTAMSAGIGGIVAIGLAGTAAVASPVFLGAVAGGAIGRGAIELLRMIDPKERKARAQIIEARAHGFAFAQRLQERARAIVEEKNSPETSDARRKEIEQQLINMHEQLITASNEHSFQLFYNAEREEYYTAPQEGESLEEFKLEGIEEKMKLQRKREKAADVGAAIGAAAGGALARQMVINHLLGQYQGGERFMADFDKDGLEHMVRHIDASQIRQATEGFENTLNQSGGWVFEYDPNNVEYINQLHLEAADLGYELNTAQLADGRWVHALGGIPSQEQLTQIASSNAGSWWKEALPVALANLLPSLAAVMIRSKSKEDAAQQNGPSKSTNSQGAILPPDKDATAQKLKGQEAESGGNNSEKQEEKKENPLTSDGSNNREVDGEKGQSQETEEGWEKYRKEKEKMAEYFGRFMGLLDKYEEEEDSVKEAISRKVKFIYQSVPYLGFKQLIIRTHRYEGKDDRLVLNIRNGHLEKAEIQELAETARDGDWHREDRWITSRELKSADELEAEYQRVNSIVKEAVNAGWERGTQPEEQSKPNE